MTAVVKWIFEDYWQGQAKTVTYYFSGTSEDFVVPDGVVEVAVNARGAAGGNNGGFVPHGGYVSALLTVTPGETLKIRVGGNGGNATGLSGASGGYNGGGDGGTTTASDHGGGHGGGGASDIRQGGDTLADRVIVAAGAGGNSGANVSYTGGNGGAAIGAEGHSASGLVSLPTGDAPGGTQSAGGGSGSRAGSLGVGGDASDTTLLNGSGGGGGGNYGGSGAANNIYGGVGGGGGSNLFDPTVTTLIASGRGTFADTDPASISIEFVGQAETYVWDINPNDGGAVTIIKNILMTQNTGPNRVNILQEGVNQAPLLDFSGVILDQGQLEMMERWFNKRVFLKLTDDLGREYYGVFSTWTPKRQRRASNFWYHSYDAEFTVSGYKNASGEWIYGRVE